MGEQIKLRLVKLIDVRGETLEMSPLEREIVIEAVDGAKRFRDWLIIVIREPQTLADRQVRAFRRAMYEHFGPKVMVLVGDIDFAVFEPVEDAPNDATPNPPLDDEEPKDVDAIGQANDQKARAEYGTEDE